MIFLNDKGSKLPVISLWYGPHCDSVLVLMELVRNLKTISTIRRGRIRFNYQLPRNNSYVKKSLFHDDVIKWKHFLRNWPFVRGIHRSPVNSPHKGQWSGALMFSLICVWINGWVNNREAGNLRRYRAHYDVIVMFLKHRTEAIEIVPRGRQWPV